MKPRIALRLYPFDLLWLNGRDLGHAPLLEGKKDAAAGYRSVAGVVGYRTQSNQGARLRSIQADL